MKTPHTSCRQRKSVKIILKNGELIFGKFKERTGNFVILYDGTKIRAGNIKSFTIDR